MKLEPPQPFELIETMVHTHRIVYLDQHLLRLQRSAEFFDIPLPLPLLKGTLTRVGEALNVPGRHKVRLTVRQSGEYRIHISPILRALPPYKTVCISPYRVDAQDIYFYHKTTHRALYNNEYDRIAQLGFYEVLFLNKEGFLAEGSRSNIFLRIDGQYHTPLLSSGLLPGVYRQLILDRCAHIVEKPLTLEDLKNADRLYLCNAITGLQRIHHIDFTPQSPQ